MGCRPKPVQAQPCGVSRHSQRSIPDETGAEERSRLSITKARWDSEAVTLVSDGVLGVTAIDLVAGEPRPIAQIFPASATEETLAAGPTQPGDPDPIAFPEP